MISNNDITLIRKNIIHINIKFNIFSNKLNYFLYTQYDICDNTTANGFYLQISIRKKIIIFIMQNLE